MHARRLVKRWRSWVFVEGRSHPDLARMDYRRVMANAPYREQGIV